MTVLYLEGCDLEVGVLIDESRKLGLVLELDVVWQAPLASDLSSLLLVNIVAIINMNLIYRINTWLCDH